LVQKFTAFGAKNNLNQYKSHNHFKSTLTGPKKQAYQNTSSSAFSSYFKNMGIAPQASSNQWNSLTYQNISTKPQQASQNHMIQRKTAPAYQGAIHGRDSNLSSHVNGKRHNYRDFLKSLNRSKSKTSEKVNEVHHSSDRFSTGMKRVNSVNVFSANRSRIRNDQGFGRKNIALRQRNTAPTPFKNHLYWSGRGGD
jgi:hypothetical protein